MTDLHKAAQQALVALTLIDEAMPFPVAKHAITALREALAAPAVPPGYALVPVEPTPEMLSALRGGPRILPAYVGAKEKADAREIAGYKAMLAAALVVPTYTHGHCKEKAKPGGCQLHNLYCGYPSCDQKVAVVSQTEDAP